MRTRLRDQVVGHLKAIYHDLGIGEHRAIAARILDEMGLDGAAAVPEPTGLPDQYEVMLITYGDTFVGGLADSGFSALSAVLRRYFDDVFSTVHILPFFESSSDGGFSVVDYRTIAARNGEWSEVAALVEDRKLMVDLVCNHGSVRSEWFQQFERGELPGRDWYKTAHRDDDLSAVVRPRTHPLLLDVATADGERQVWATFSHDQVDFDFANPDVLVEFCSIIAFYLKAGASRIRLDAIAYLWKEVGTRCIHLPQTHEVVKLMRSLSSAADPDSLLITETNVPHDENIAYFGDGDEAHVVYNFTLAPLLVWSAIAQQAGPLTSWLAQLEAPPSGCTFLNFIASHDGLGLRPIEDLVDDAQLELLLTAARDVGGDWSAYAAADGLRPYELNVSLADLLAGVDGSQVDRFLVAHAAMLAVQGVPAIYVHSILASAGDHRAVLASGHLRDINRSQIPVDEVDARLAAGWRSDLTFALCDMIRVRRNQPAFAPEAEQVVHDLHPDVVAVERRCDEQAILALHNFSERACEVTVPEWALGHDLLTGSPRSDARTPVALGPWQVCWLGQAHA